MMKTKLKTQIKTGVLFFLTVLVSQGSLWAQQSKNAMFYKADVAMRNAQDLKADVLVPTEYGKAFSFYQDAEKLFANNKGIEKVEAKLIEAITFFNRASDFSYSARIVFANSLNAREDAISAGADFYAKEQWDDAEKQFSKAAKELEKGDRDDSYKEAVKAIELYRKAELTAIKTDLLDATRKLIKQAEDMDVDDKAPKTFEKAKSLLAETEKELESNRYDMDYPRILAKQAKYEAMHSIALYKAIKKNEDNKMKMEDVILASEIPLINIAEAFGFVAQFDQSSDIPENRIKINVWELQQANQRLNTTNSQQYYYIDQLEANVSLLKKEIDAMNKEFKNEISKRSSEMKSVTQKIEAEKAKLTEKINAQTRINQKFDEVYALFTRAEANVFRSKNDVIIRLHGFDFEVGKTEIKPDYFALLTKVQSAIKTFPDSKVIIEGYTDSYGSDSLNLVLSQKRSDAVTEYLQANMPELKSMDVTSVGQGENNPVANNETQEGRRKNRRIDVIIKPQM